MRVATLTLTCCLYTLARYPRSSLRFVLGLLGSSCRDLSIPACVSLLYLRLLSSIQTSSMSSCWRRVAAHSSAPSIVHWTRWLGWRLRQYTRVPPNNSFEPNPLRESA